MCICGALSQLFSELLIRRRLTQRYYPHFAQDESLHQSINSTGIAATISVFPHYCSIVHDYRSESYQLGHSPMPPFQYTCYFLSSFRVSEYRIFFVQLGISLSLNSSLKLEVARFSKRHHFNCTISIWLGKLQRTFTKLVNSVILETSKHESENHLEFQFRNSRS